MFMNDSRAIGINAHPAVEVFEVSSDVRRYHIFPLKGTGIVSKLPNSPILLDFTPSETKYKYKHRSRTSKIIHSERTLRCHFRQG